ncbi:hypothetical protein [Peribacillus simplex]|uniref:hypothetical protein n=1 Tax=Peribacillus simplex TaxID=1478 RepID=UPI0012D935CA|nr:hypothetical protein [Peribacillus simplex]
MIIVRDNILIEDENYSQSNNQMNSLKNKKQFNIKEDGVCNGLGIHFIDNRYIWFCDEICTE